ncbi:DUF4296 domain-containing protein [Fluviicola sp.]|uniref:DUF4296 domain-containing protein n=1 Tax=Fluviicola sp. TaxID=1917219 RepID=UPI003D2A217D
MRIALIIFILWGLQSCNSELHGLKKPDKLIPKDQMIRVMTDMLILEGHIQTTYTSVNRYYKVMSASGRSYLKTQHISQKQYEDSFAYYSSKNEEYRGMMEKVMENLQKESIELQKKS